MPRSLLVLSAALVGALLAAAPMASAAEGDPTYAKDVAPIIFDNCVSCHRPGNIAPMSFRTYAETRPWSRAIKDKVVNREMPPWHAAPGGREIRNWRGLEQEEIDTIVAWVDGGAPLGDAADMPPLPPDEEGWRHPDGSDPDYVIAMPVEMQIPAEGEMPYLQRYQPVPFESDVFAAAIEIRPGNRATVHHMTANTVDLPEDARIVDGVLVGPGGEEVSSRDVATEGLAGASKLLAWVPGRGFEMHRPGVAKKIGADKYVQWSLHYTPTGRPEVDRSEMGLWLTDEPVHHEILSRIVGSPLPTDPAGQRLHVVDGKEISGRERLPVIPPHAEDWRIVSITNVTEPITLFAMSAHMHLRGKAMRFAIEWPDGSEETILDVPNFDFNWQSEYEVVEPIAIPAGSRLINYGVYDNSIRNRWNPAPDKEVYWGEQSWDEMFEGWIKYTIDSQDLTATGQTEE